MTTRRWPRRVGVAAAVLLALVGGLWTAIHRVRGFGPALADGARALFGPRVVAFAEDVAYGAADRINRVVYRRAKPKTFWEAPPTARPEAPTPSAAAAPPPAEAGAAFPPPAFQPPFPSVAGEGEGTWIAMDEPQRDAAADGHAMVKSIVHPDPKRNFAAVAVVALDLRRLDLHLVAGTQEPFSMTVHADKRPGLVPKDDAADLVAVFNGGFKSVHGHYGMMLGGDTFLPPRDVACTVALYRDGGIKIRTWTELKESEGAMLGYRQTPPCLVEQGDTNRALDLEYNRNWGATVSGDTVIRRSAIGVDGSGHTLFYGLGDAVTAQALSRAMKAVGAENAAELDVNYSYPRFLLFGKSAADAPPRVCSALIPDLKFVSTEYVSDASPRDFFYVSRRRPSSS